MAFAAWGRLARHDVSLLDSPRCRQNWGENVSAFCQVHRTEVWEALAALPPRPLTYDLQGYSIGRLAVEVAAARVGDTLRLPALRLDVPAVPVPPA